MSKRIDNLIEKKVKAILEKDVLTDDDLKFLILYRNSEKINPFEKFISGAKKIMEVINGDDNKGGNE